MFAQWQFGEVMSVRNCVLIAEIRSEYSSE